MTAEDFAALRPGLPDGGRWTELVDGQPVVLQPPEEVHGTFVSNLAKHLAGCVARGGAGAVAEVGVCVRDDPATVRHPAFSLFPVAELFAQMDRVVASAVPAVVVEVTNVPGRRDAARRVAEYHAAGVAAVWLADGVRRTLSVAEEFAAPRSYAGDERIAAGPLLPGFDATPEELFRVPAWWTSGVRRRREADVVVSSSCEASASPASAASVQ